MVGCGGENIGQNALYLATLGRYMDIMRTLTMHGVNDTGSSLIGAATDGYEEGVEFLLQQRHERGPACEVVAYVNARDPGNPRFDATPLVCCIGVSSVCSPSVRIARLLVDAGADTTSIVQVTNRAGRTTSVNAARFYRL